MVVPPRGDQGEAGSPQKLKVGLVFRMYRAKRKIVHV